MVARSNQHSPWDFVDAFSRRDLLQSLSILNALQNETPVSLLYLCVIRLRELLYYKSLLALGDRDIPKALSKPDWQIRRIDALASRYKASELRKLLSKAANADMRMKSGENAQLVFEELILSSCQ